MLLATNNRGQHSALTVACLHLLLRYELCLCLLGAQPWLMPAAAGNAPHSDQHRGAW